ncbi:MAG: tyrosine-type recombinase/integrase [Culicoidibacterales bacterium]
MNNRPKYEFSSCFAPLIRDFIELKRACGYTYTGEEHQLKRFDKYLVAIRHHKMVLTRSVVERWLNRTSHETQRNQAARIYTLKLFTRFLGERGYKTFMPDNFSCKIKKCTYIPYIFTHKQINMLFLMADQIGQASKRSMIATIFPTILRLMYSTGVRANEALSVKWNDVDLQNGVIVIRAGKYRKDRSIPLSFTMLKCFKEYAINQKALTPDTPCFPGPTGKAINVRTLYTHFRNTLFLAGIPHEGRGKGPRLHDIRHTFAVHNLEKWFLSKQDLRTNLSILVDYLGHESMMSTQIYLRLLPSIFPEIKARMDSSVGQVILKGIDNETD